MPIVETLVSFYGLLSLTHLFIQINLSHSEYLRTKKDSFVARFTPKVAIIIPTYNEDSKALERCVKSCIRQDYKGLYKILVVNDGSRNPNGFLDVRRKFRRLLGLHFINLPQNQGKRHAQKHGFDFVEKWADIIVTIDSDTIADPKALQNIVQKFQDPNIGAVTGDVRVIKTSQFLSHLISGRYWMAFHQERAAQSLFGTVLCCSGPLAAYRNNVIQKVKADYISQEFLGKKCTYGDDRHLTNLVLREGYSAKFERRARAWTHVPENIKGYLKQQTRWNKSFYRELLWTLKIAFRDRRKLPIYIFYDLLIQTFLPLLFIVSLAFSIYQSIVVAPQYLFGYIAVMVGISLIRSLYGFYRTGDTNLLKFPAYSFIYVFLLIPVRLYAIATLGTTHWGTR